MRKVVVLAAACLVLISHAAAAAPVIYDQFGTIQSITQVPEPGTLLLFGLALTMAATVARRGRQRSDSMRAPARAN